MEGPYLSKDTLAHLSSNTGLFGDTFIMKRSDPRLICCDTIVFAPTQELSVHCFCSFVLQNISRLGDGKELDTED